MRKAARQAPMAIACPVDAGFGAVLGALEGEFLARLDASDHERMGVAKTCIIEVRVPDGLALHAAQQRLEEALPTVRIKVMERFPGSWWGRYRRGIAIAMGGGLAVAPMAGLLRPAVARLREPPG